MCNTIVGKWLDLALLQKIPMHMSSSLVEIWTYNGQPLVGLNINWLFKKLKNDTKNSIKPSVSPNTSTFFILYSLLWGRLREQIIQFI
jgi:hypothetical protein